MKGYGDRIAARRDDGTYQLVGGRRGKADVHAPYIAALRVEAGRRGQGALSEIRLFAPIDVAELSTTTDTELVWDGSVERVLAFKMTRYRDLIVERRSTPNVERAAAGAILAEAAKGALERVFASLETADETLIARLITMTRQHPELGLPTERSAWLAAALPAMCEGKSSLAELQKKPAVSLGDALRRLLPWEAERMLRERFPERFEVPSGSHIRIDYQIDGPPSLAVKIQEVFGLETTPAVDGGRMPLTLHLLSPAGRPLQVTRDLPSFWSRTWSAVRAEMRSRYPRHFWPEDPAKALPSRSTKARNYRPEDE